MRAANLNELVSRFTTGYGLVDCPLDTCSEALPTFRRGPDRAFSLTGTTTDPAKALEHLSLLSHPPTRHILLAASETCSVLINNRRDGSDYADYTYFLPRHLECRFARIVNAPRRVWSNGKERELLQYEARIFELYDEEGEAIRSVHCTDDGDRWQFGEHGTPHPIEASFPYGARKTRDRFKPEHVDVLVSAYALSPISTKTFLESNKFFLYTVPNRTAMVCTIAEADDPAYAYFRRGLTWVPRMKSHFESVIADFERCIRLNPNYEPRVRRHLRQAYKAASRAK